MTSGTAARLVSTSGLIPEEGVVGVSEAAEGWARTVLTVVHITPVRTRPWASVSRVEAEDGVWWLETASERTAYEVPLMDLLAGSGSPLAPG